MSDTTHQFPSLAARGTVPAERPVVVPSTAWSGLPVGQSRFQQVRRQLRVMQVQRVTNGTRAA